MKKELDIVIKPREVVTWEAEITNVKEILHKLEASIMVNKAFLLMAEKELRNYGK